MKKIKIAQIGTSKNSHGTMIWNSLVKQSDIFEVVGYAMPENEKEKFYDQVKPFLDYPELSLDEILQNPEIEAVAVETEEKYLTKYALMCAEHKKHIHMEKPGGIELCDFEKLIALVKENKTVFHTGYMYRYNPAIIDTFEKIERGELGDIISVEAQMSCPEPAAVRQWLSDYPGGMMFFLGCHLVDLILRIKGEPEKITSFNASTGFEGISSKDYGMAVFEYDSGASFVKTNAWEPGGFGRRQLVVTGTRASIEIKPLEWCAPGGKQYTELHEIKGANWHEKAEVMHSAPVDRYDPMTYGFAERVRGKEEKIYTPDYELTLYKTLLKCCK